MTGYQNPRIGVVLLGGSVLLWMGWLLTLDTVSHRLSVFHPLTRYQLYGTLVLLIALATFWLSKLADKTDVHTPQATPSTAAPVPVLTPTTSVPSSAGREFVVGLSAADIIGLYRNKTDYQGRIAVTGYKGKWLAVSGTIGEVAKSGDQVLVYLKLTKNNLDSSVGMYFGPQYESVLSQLRKGQTFDGIGRIQDVTRSSMVLEDCELKASR